MISQVVQERVHKLFGLDYNSQYWSWLLDPARPEVPLTVPRPSALAGDEMGLDHIVQEEAESQSGRSPWSRWSARRSDRTEKGVEEKGNAIIFSGFGS